MPAGETWIVKTIMIYDASTTTGQWVVQVARSSNGTAVPFESVNLSPAQLATWSGYLVMRDGDTIQSSVPGIPSAFWISGVVLMGVQPGY